MKCLSCTMGGGIFISRTSLPSYPLALAIHSSGAITWLKQRQHPINRISSCFSFTTMKFIMVNTKSLKILICVRLLVWIFHIHLKSCSFHLIRARVRVSQSYFYKCNVSFNMLSQLLHNVVKQMKTLSVVYLYFVRLTEFLVIFWVIYVPIIGDSW